MRTRPSRRAAKYGLAALVSFSLIAAACGGSDDDASEDTTADTTADTEVVDTSDATATSDAPDGTEAPAGTEAHGRHRSAGRRARSRKARSQNRHEHRCRRPGPGRHAALRARGRRRWPQPHSVGAVVAGPDDDQRRVRLAGGLSPRRRSSPTSPSRSRRAPTSRLDDEAAPGHHVPRREPLTPTPSSRLRVPRNDPLVGLAVKPFFPRRRRREGSTTSP